MIQTHTLQIANSGYKSYLISSYVKRINPKECRTDITLYALKE